MQDHCDVDHLYEQRLDISDLDIEGFDDIGDDIGYGSLPDDIAPDTIVVCEKCKREVEWRDSAGYGTDDVFCMSCWDKELKGQQRYG